MSTKRQKREKLRFAQEQETNERLKYATAKTLIGIFVLALMFFAWGSQALPITDPVESNYALTAKEMVLSGNWMSPQIYGQFWYDKPIMVYWFLSLSYTIFGFTDFASRFPAALCGALTIPTLIWYIRRITKDNIVSIWSGVMLATSFEFWIISHAIITDSMLMLFTIPTFLSAYIGLTENNKRHLTIAYAAAGLACLSKGPVGLALPGLLFLIWCVWMKEKELFFRLFPWQGILAFLIITLPWYGGMYLIHGNDFITEFLGLHNVLRATVSEHPNDNHFYYYLILFPLSVLPWIGLSLYQIKKSWADKPAFYKFLMVWCIGTILFYTLMATKYVTYTYIAIAPAVILAAHAAPDVTEGKKLPGLLAIIPFFLLISALFTGTFFIPNVQWWPFYIVFAYAVWALVFRWNRNAHMRLTVISTVTASAFLVVIISGLPVFLHTRSSIDMAEYFHSLPGKHYFFNTYETSYAYYTGDPASRLSVKTYSIKAKTGSSDVEKRDNRWNNKSPIPTITEEEFRKSDPTKPVYLYVDNKNAYDMMSWDLSDRFSIDKVFDNGIIFKLEQ